MRPLDGIWTTAPHLNNGSVANLYEILLPAKRRMAAFQVGSIVPDTERVGFETGKGPFAFDTAKPGNSNAGSDYGTDQLTAEQRWQLVGYMKTL